MVGELARQARGADADAARGGADARGDRTGIGVSRSLDSTL
jgi:hypothetical protein